MPPSSRGRHGRRAGDTRDVDAEASGANEGAEFSIWIKSFDNPERPLDGRSIELRGVVGSDTIESVKEKLQHELGVPREHQHLQFLGKDLRDWHTLAHYKVGAERTVAEDMALQAANQATTVAERILAEVAAEEAANKAPEKETGDEQESTATKSEAQISLEQLELDEAAHKAAAELEAARAAHATEQAQKLAKRNAEIPLILRVKTVDYGQALAVVSKNGVTLQYVSPALQADREIVLSAVRQNGSALEYAGGDPSLQCDKEVVLEAVQQFGLALEFAAETLQEDQEVVMASVLQNGLSLQHAAKKLQANQEVVLHAVGQNGYALRYASVEMQADKQVVLAAVKQRGAALAYASAPLRRDPAINRAALGSGWK